MATALAEPLASIDDLTIISNDGAGRLFRSVAGNLQRRWRRSGGRLASTWVPCWTAPSALRRRMAAASALSEPAGAE